MHCQIEQNICVENYSDIMLFLEHNISLKHDLFLLPYLLGHYLFVEYRTSDRIGFLKGAMLKSPSFPPPPKYNNIKTSKFYRSCKVRRSYYVMFCHQLSRQNRSFFLVKTSPVEMDLLVFIRVRG